MKNGLKRVISCFLCMIMVVTSVSAISFAKDKEFSVTISIEGETLGQGFYVEPTCYTLSEINSLVSAEGYGPYTEDTLTAGMVTLAMIIDCGLECNYTGSWDSDVYLSSIKGIDNGVIDIPDVIGENGGPSNEENDGNDDEYLGEFDYSMMSGWMITVNHHMIGVGCGRYDAAEAETEGSDFGDGSVIRWQFSAYGYGMDLGVDTGWGMGDPYYTAANKCDLYRTYAELAAEGFFINHPSEKEAVLEVMENLTASQKEVDDALADLRDAAAAKQLDYSVVLNETLTQMAATITAPAFGTTAGEWSVISLARGGYYEKNSTYFNDYYKRIVETVNTTAESVNLGGALHKTKSTENSRLIMALSAIGKDARKVGNWNLVEAYSTNGFTWIKKQGINGPIFALIALDSNNYKTTDSTLRQQCIDFILSKELEGGGWALSGTSADPDVTSMALQSLVPYTDDTKVAAAVNRAFNALSSMQQMNGGFSSWGSINSESIAQVIVACTAHGIDPATDARFVKNGRSAVDALLDFYIAEGHGFAHVLTSGGGYTGGEVNAMATDQACYALVAYNRYKAKSNRLYDMTDAFDKPEEMKAAISIPENVGNTNGTEFKATVSINTWNNEADYKLFDAIVNVPEGMIVTDIVPSSRLSEGKVSYNLDSASGKLRIVYFDAEKLTSLTLSNGAFPAELFTISFKLTKDFEPGAKFALSISGMSLKCSSDPSNEDAMLVVDTSAAVAQANVTKGISYSAVCIYEGDGIDLIPADKKAVAVFVSELKSVNELVYNKNESIKFYYSEELSCKCGIVTYVAIVPASLPMENLVKAENFTLNEANDAESIRFGDVNGDTKVNAQDALNTVNMWLRKVVDITDKQILVSNINADSRISTFDALGIVESFVNGTEYAVIMNTISAVNN